jgi:hypothetical protein
VQANGDNSFSSLFEVFNHVQLGAIVYVGFLNHSYFVDKVPFLRIEISSLIAVVAGIVLNENFHFVRKFISNI